MYGHLSFLAVLIGMSFPTHIIIQSADYLPVVTTNLTVKMMDIDASWESRAAELRALAIEDHRSRLKERT